MSIGPIRRLVGLLGLVALTPTAAILVAERVSAVDAALRAVATLLLTMLLGRLVSWWVTQMARGLDATAGAGDRADLDGARRRTADVPVG